MHSYPHREIDSKWQAFWAEEGLFTTPEDHEGKKYYVLDMFPYPSGSGLHVGHPKGYVATDVVARAKRMMGFNVLRVMGWDSFGLPAERQAVREGRHPREVTKRNVATFKRQLARLGLSYDWSREFATSDPEYYRWTQWIFLKLYEKGLAYRADVPVNWCPALQTVLANEEVKDGAYVETGDPVEKRHMKQWMLRITDYAERLLAGLDGLDWPESVKAMQREWIGRSEGAEIRFEVEGHEAEVVVFTTRPDTLFGCTYVVLGPEHQLLDRITIPERREEVRAYVEKASKRSERERIAAADDAQKTGVFTGAFVLNPINRERVPVWVADYVLATYGTGAVFACPAHDDRDHAFARQFGLPIHEVVRGGDTEQAAFTGDGPHVDSGFLDGLDNAAAMAESIAWLKNNGRGRAVVRYRLRDWLFSRQRYWGEPFPIIYLEDGSAKALPEDALPVLLPELDDLRPTEDGRPPLSRAKDWMLTRDPVTGQPARRETSTMPQWAGSCWYYLRFVSPHLASAAWDADAERYWMPVDLYVGGAEHATLHLLYARFWHHVLHDLGLVSTPEPFRRLFNQGMIHATSFQDARGKYYYRHDIEERDGRYFVKGSDVEVSAKREKMSKSRYNVVNPDDVCDEQGADALRLYELFLGPLEDGVDWDSSGVSGLRRFLDRVWRLVVDEETGGPAEKLVDEQAPNIALERALHSAIRKVTESIDSLRFNTAISEMMVFVNEATRAEAVPRDLIDTFLRVLSPFAPHVTEEMWRRLGHESSVLRAPWPKYDPAKLIQDTVTIAVQVNGKMRGTIEVPAGAGQEEVLSAAAADDRVAPRLSDKRLLRKVFVPERLVNFVVRD